MENMPYEHKKRVVENMPYEPSCGYGIQVTSANIILIKYKHWITAIIIITFRDNEFLQAINLAFRFFRKK